MINYSKLLSDWIPVIGVEIHVQLGTKSKMFSPCKWHYGESPNTLTCPLTMAYPGTLPTINKKAVESAIIIGKTLNCRTCQKCWKCRLEMFRIFGKPAVIRVGLGSVQSGP